MEQPVKRNYAHREVIAIGTKYFPASTEVGLALDGNSIVLPHGFAPAPNAHYLLTLNGPKKGEIVKVVNGTAIELAAHVDWKDGKVNLTDIRVPKAWARSHNGELLVKPLIGRLSISNNAFALQARAKLKTPKSLGAYLELKLGEYLAAMHGDVLAVGGGLRVAKYVVLGPFNTRALKA